MSRRSMLILVLGATIAVSGGPAAQPKVLRVGTWNGVPGQYKAIQAAVNAAHPGD